MKNVFQLARAAGLVAAVAGFGLTGCTGGGGGGGSGAGNGGGGNNSKFSGRFFPGSGGNNDANGGMGGTPAAGGPGGEVPGGGGGPGGEVPGGGGGVDQASCTVACTTILSCLVSTCELTLEQSDLAEASAL
ncbi:MAG: hypothetical protein KC583_00500, partial [Myxococcales bacterium]|nr:hypothetical protein [Myxococcales bacterium]